MSRNFDRLPLLTERPVLSRAQKALVAQRVKERRHAREAFGHMRGLYGSPARPESRPGREL